MRQNAEEIEKKSRRYSISRREFLRLSGLVGLSMASAGNILAGCAPAATPPPAVPTEVSAAATPNAPPKFKIAVFHGGSINDEGWDMLLHQAMLAVAKKFPFTETAYVENQPYSGEGTRVLEQLANDGANIIFLATEYADIMYEAAANCPDTIFLECNGHKAEGNVSWFYIEHWDTSYLIGMAAGLMTKTNKLGYVGSFPYPSVLTSVNSFHLGARAVNPDVTTNVVLVNSWFDPAAERSAAEALINNDADMLFGIMGTPVYLQVAEEKGKMAATWTVDSREFGPNAYISSCLSDWIYYYTSAAEQYLNKTLEPSKPVLLPMGKGTDRDAWGQNVPADVAKQVDEVREKMLNEGINVFKGPISDTKGNLRVKEGESLDELTMYSSWDWVVEGVTGID